MTDGPSFKSTHLLHWIASGMSILGLLLIGPYIFGDYGRIWFLIGVALQFIAGILFARVRTAHPRPAWSDEVRSASPWAWVVVAIGGVFLLVLLVSAFIR